ILPTGMELSFLQVILAFHMLVTWIFVLPFFWMLRPTVGGLPLTISLARLLTVNPLRLVSNTMLLNAPISSGERVQAVRKLGRSRSPLVVSDLVEKLDDPSADVREH